MGERLEIVTHTNKHTSTTIVLTADNAMNLDNVSFSNNNSFNCISQIDVGFGYYASAGGISEIYVLGTKAEPFD